MDRRWLNGVSSNFRGVWLLVAAAWLSGGRTRVLFAQGVTTATIRGTVSPGDARVRVVNEATGFQFEVNAHAGRFVLHGLEAGGPYTVRARYPGYTPVERKGLYLPLGQPLDVQLMLPPLSMSLDTMRIRTTERKTGTVTTIADSLLHRLPTLNRDMYDFVRLAPQISTKVSLAGGGISSGGTNVRFNNFLIDGASDRFLTGNSASAFGGGKSVPIDAISEYQVLVAPFDVRYGDFTGALVNAVTKSGTNTFHASGFAFERNERFARSVPAIRDAPYERTQFGFTISGPLIHNRLHFLVAPEFQRIASPARGPYLGQASSVLPRVPVSASDVERLSDIMRGYGLEPGSGGAVTTGSPTANLFARLDLTLPSRKSRAVLLTSFAQTNNRLFSRAATDTFALSSLRVTQAFTSWLTALQFHTTASGGRYNVAMLSLRSVWGENQPEVREPLVLVSVPNAGAGTEILKAGSPESTNGVLMRAHDMSLSDNLSLPVGAAHEITLGGQAVLFRLERGGVNGSYGTWTFSNLDAFAAGVADRYQLKKDFGSASAPMNGAQYAAFVADEWHASDRLTATFGVRADAFALLDHAPYSAAIDSLFARRTDQMPRTRIHLSPRLGFNWDLFGNGRDQIRGGAGVFTGRYPASWAYASVYSYGSGIGSLQCGSLPTDLGPPPRFEPDYRAAPTACANGKGVAAAPRGDVDLMNSRLNLAQSVRASLGYDRRLPGDVTLTAEALITHNTSDFVFVNLNLKGPQGIDPHGRVLYGTVAATGVATPALISNYSEVFDLKNVSSNHAFQVDAKIDKAFSRGVAASASYTFTRVRDVELPLRAGVSDLTIWSSSRVVSGRHDDLSTGVSLYDLPHRVVVAATWTAPWWHASTTVSLHYVGESGTPFTYVAGGVGRRGDLNADGAIGNDPLYIPTDAADGAQIRFSGVSDSTGADNSTGAQSARVVQQQHAFERFIAATPCLQRERGRIMKRNSCREPWSHTSIATLRQTLPRLGAHALTVQLDLFNVLDLLGSRMGQYRVADPILLSQVGQVTAASDVVQPIFRFDTARPRWSTLVTESSYQFQLAARYSF